MKKVHIFVAATLVLFVAWTFASPAGAPQGEEGLLIGEVIDITGYAKFGRLGEEHIEAGQYRAGHGFPIGILEDETEDVWIAVYRLPVPAAGLQTANSVLKPYMGQTVVAQGTKYRVKGANLIQISLVSEY